MNKPTVLVLALLCATAFSGCVGDNVDADSVMDASAGTSVAVTEDTTLTFGPHSGLPTERDENWTASLDEPPQWTLGEWWEIEVTDLLITGDSFTITRIAAGKEGVDLLVGMPLEEFSDQAMIFHIPGFGLVKSDSLGFEMHDYLFEPLKFPLEAGDSWDSTWEGPAPQRQITHSVADVDRDAMTATITFQGTNNAVQSAEYVYDAELGAIRDFFAPGYMEYHVVDHGFDYEGVVRVPYSHDMTIFHGRLGPVSPISLSQGTVVSTTGGCAPTIAVNGCLVDASAPTETFTIPEEGPNGVKYDRASFALIIAELAPLLVGDTDPVIGAAPLGAAWDATGQGHYQIDLQAPNGESYSLQKAATESGHKISSHFNNEPAGEWSLNVIGAGAAQVFVEGITYTTFDVSLPSGCIVVSEQIHDHGGECGGHVHNIE